MQTVYIETTIPSYLAAHPSSSVVMAAHQQITREWWESRRKHFSVYSSSFVRAEAEKGDVAAARRRLTYLVSLPELAITERAEGLAAEIFGLLNLPPKAVIDASHLALAVVHRIDYLLTWNCNHIANAALQRKLMGYCQQKGLHMPIICTPESLMED